MNNDDLENLYSYVNVSLANLPENLKSYVIDNVYLRAWDYLPADERLNILSQSSMDAGFAETGEWKRQQEAHKLKGANLNLVESKSKLDKSESFRKQYSAQQSKKAKMKRGIKDDKGVTINDLISDTAKQYLYLSPSEAWPHFFSKVEDWSPAAEELVQNDSQTCHYEQNGKTGKIAYKTFAEKYKKAKNTR